MKHYLLAFIELFNVWQMGVIFYSYKTLTINNFVNTPVVLDNSLILIIMGYLIGVILIYFLPKKTILLGKISSIISLICSITLIFPITSTVFLTAYYLLTFNCVFFISINTSLIINYYSNKSALLDVILGTIITGVLIALCQQQIIPFSFNIFNIISIICLSLITYALFKIDNSYNVVFIEENEKICKNYKRYLFEILLIQFVACLNTLFNSSVAQDIKNGVSISYIGGTISGLLFLFLYKKKRILPRKIFTYYFGIVAVGFSLYLFPISELKSISIFLQGFSLLLILAIPYLANILFNEYPSKKIAPSLILIAISTVIIDSILLELFKNNSTILYSSYAFISILASIIYLLFERDFKLESLDKKVILDKLSKREQEVAALLIKGLSSKDISIVLFISEHTTKDHIKNIYKKYNIHSRLELINLISSI